MTMATTTENAAMCPSVEVPVEPLMNKKGASAQYCTPKTIVRKSKPRLSKKLIRRAKVIAGYIVISLFICSIGGLIHMKIEQNALKDEILTTKGEVAQLKRIVQVFLMAENRQNHQNRPESPPMADEDDDNQDLDYGKDSPIDELSDGTGLSSGKDSFVDEPSNGVVPSPAGRVKRDSIISEGKRRQLDLFMRTNHADNVNSRGKREANKESKTKTQKKKRDKKKKGRNKKKRTQSQEKECPPQHKCRHSHECVNAIHLLPNFMWEDLNWTISTNKTHTHTHTQNGLHNVSTLFSGGNVPVVHGKYGHLEEGELFSPLEGTSAINDGKYRYWRPDPSLHPHNKSSCMHYDTDSGRLTIKKPGFYYIYSQMTYVAYARYRSYTVQVQQSSNQTAKTLFRCLSTVAQPGGGGVTSTTSSSDKQPQRQGAQLINSMCSTGGMQYLEENSQIWIEDHLILREPGAYRRILFDPARSFWGALQFA